jgi:hypothetical protein
MATRRNTSNFTNVEVSEDFIASRLTGKGIRVGGTATSFPWRDLEGPIRPKDTGVGKPTLSTYRAPIRAFSFIANDIVDLEFHWPHDWVPGTDVYIHTHWSHTGTNITGSLVLEYSWSFAKGHNQSVFPAATTLTHTVGSLSLAGYPQYQHIISETQLSAATPAAGQIDTDNLEVDGLLLMSLTPTTIPTITAGSLFIHYVDIHYQSSNIGTKQKSPNFYAD